MYTTKRYPDNSPHRQLAPDNWPSILKHLCYVGQVYFYAYNVIIFRKKKEVCFLKYITRPRLEFVAINCNDSIIMDLHMNVTIWKSLCSIQKLLGSVVKFKCIYAYKIIFAQLMFPRETPRGPRAKFSHRHLKNFEENPRLYALLS